jgi:hypothetical protein
VQSYTSQTELPRRAALTVQEFTQGCVSTNDHNGVVSLAAPRGVLSHPTPHERDFHEPFSAIVDRCGCCSGARRSSRDVGAIRRGHAARARASECRRDGEECRHRRHAPHALGRRRQLHAGRTAPGTYRVDAGAGTETVVTLSVASTATLDLVTGEATAETEAPMQEVVVSGRRLNEVKTSEVGATVSQQQIESVPQMTRNFMEFADTVPGVVFQVDANGKTSIRGGAQNANGVNLYIDGVGQKGYVRSGVSGQAGDTQGNPFPQLAIGEYKVITSNYKAEYDQISSAAITAISRSGTNEFEGQAFGTYSADNWRAMTPAEHNSGIKSESETKEYGVGLRRSHHAGPHALLPDLRSQAIHHAGHGDPGDDHAARHPRAACPRMRGSARARHHRLRRGPVFCEARLRAHRCRSIRAVAEDS